MTEQTPLPEAVHPAFATPMAAIMHAVTMGKPEIVQALLALEERHEARQKEREANEARKAYEAAMAAAAAEMPAIVKDIPVQFESQRTGQRTSYKHEDLGDMIEQVRPVLAKHGLNVRWRTEVGENNRIVVTCRVVHRDGHYEENSLPGMPDTSGQKNEMQAMGSGISYLQRYTFKASLGLAASRDDDARSIAAAAYIAPEQVAAIEGLIADIKDAKALQKVLTFAQAKSLAEIPVTMQSRVIQWLRAKKQAEAAEEESKGESA